MGNDCAYENPPVTLNQSACIQFEEEMPRFRGIFNFQKQSAYNKIQNAAKHFCLVNQIDPAYIPVVSRLLAYNHHHYFAAFKSIPSELRQKFTQSIKHLQVQQMDSLFTHLILHQQSQTTSLAPSISTSPYFCPPTIKFSELKVSQLRQSQQLGLNLLWKKKIAIMIMVSGYQEMQEHSSKCLQILPTEGHPTKLEYMFAKVMKNLRKNKIAKATSPLETESLPIIIACNSMNLGWITKYLTLKKFFGFDEKLVKIVPIKNLPILNESGKLCLSFQYKTLVYPEGSAKCLQLLLDHTTHLRSFLKYNKIEYIHVLSCQNDSECPADPIFVGLASRLDRKIFAKCIPPNDIYDGGMRYVRSQNRLHLLGIKQLQRLSNLQLLKISPVALNSMLFQVSWLLDLIDDYEIELALSRRYHAKEVYCNYYDFIQNKPIVNAKCFAFQKDIRDYICVSEKAQLLQYDRTYFKDQTFSNLL